MTRHAQCKVAVRLIGILIAGLTFADAWHAAHTMFFNRIWFGVYLDWLWPFTIYDNEALDDLGTLIQFALALVLMFFAGPVSRLVMWRMRPDGECPKCGYDVRGVTGTCPECGAKLARESR
jgi:hypothetical protein